MITTVSLNPCVDRTITLDRFVYGGLNRAVSARGDGAGKAVNVAIVAASLGVQAECVGFLHRENGRIIENRLLLSGVSGDFVWLDGHVRTNIKLVDVEKGVVTEINESGAPVSEKDLEQMTELVLNHAQDSDYLVLTGSLPPGCPSDYYRTLIEAVEGLNCRCILDAEREALAQGLQARPFMIKPNQAELEAVVGHPLGSVHEVRDAALHFINHGVSVVAVSMGVHGALITDGEQTLYAPHMDVPVKSTVGAGDSMVAGLTIGFLSELPLEEAFRMGVACGTASVMTEGTQLVQKSTYKQLLDKMIIQKVTDS